jgi:plasmid stabilization system protein ParE
MAADYVRKERSYLAQYSVSAAEELGRKLRNARSLLQRHPEIGKVKPGSNGVRVMTIAPYVMEYEILPDEIMILIVRHGRQDENDREILPEAPDDFDD